MSFRFESEERKEEGCVYAKEFVGFVDLCGLEIFISFLFCPLKFCEIITWTWGCFGDFDGVIVNFTCRFSSASQGPMLVQHVFDGDWFFF